MNRTDETDRLPRSRRTHLPGLAAGTPRVSIIIATWNAAATLERCLASIANQAYEDWEIVVADGASTDGTLDILRCYEQRIAHWHSRPDGGIYDAWNQALVHARGEYVCFLGADDAWASPQALEQVFMEIGECEYDLVTGLGRMVDAAGTALHQFGRPWDYRGVARRMTICHPGALHRRDLFARFGLFDTRYRIVGDYEFILRLPANLRTHHIDAVLVDISDGGVSRDRWWSMLLERYRAQSRSPRVGRMRAAFNFLDKLWRILLGKALGIPH